MSVSSKCPSSADLRELLEGSSADSDQAAVVSHLDQCSSCQQSLEALACGGPEICLFKFRLVGSVTAADMLSTAIGPHDSHSAPNVNCFAQVNTWTKSSPCENRFVTFVCSESYQVLPMGDHRLAMVPYCGNGRSD